MCDIRRAPSAQPLLGRVALPEGPGKISAAKWALPTMGAVLGRRHIRSDRPVSYAMPFLGNVGGKQFSADMCRKGSRLSMLASAKHVPESANVLQVPKDL